MFTIFDFEKEMDPAKIAGDIEKVRSRFDSKSTSTNHITHAPTPPTYWDRQSVECHNPGLCNEVLDKMW